MDVAKQIQGTPKAKTTPGSELLDCIELPILVVDRDCTIVRFNPAAAALLSLTSSDFGTPLRRIQMLAEVQNVEELCEHAIANGASTRLDVPDGTGSWFSLKIGCYKADNQNIEGAVLTFNNVTAFRESLERAIEEREYTKAILNTISEALVVVDEDLKVQSANQAFYELFQTSREISQGAHLYELASHHWDIPRLRTLLNGSVRPNGGLGMAEFDLTFLPMGRRVLLLNARRLIRGSHGPQMTLIAIQDITERRQAMDSLRESEEELRILDRVGATLSSELELKKLVQAVTDAGRELSQAEFGAFFYNDTDAAGEKYFLYTLSGVPEEAFRKFPMPRNTGVFGPTFRGEGTVRVADIRQDPRYGKNAPYYGIPKGHLPVRSYLAVPVISRSGEVIGGLFYGHSQVGVFTERAQRLIEGIAKQAAIGIDNARLFEASQKQRAQAEESERRFRAIVETTPGCVKLVSPDGTLLHMNSAGLKMIGADFAEAVVGKNVYDLIAPEDRERYQEFNERICRGEQGSLEFDVLGLNGERRRMETHAAPLQSADGSCMQLAVALDITERQRAERALRESEQRFRVITEAAPIMVWMAGTDKLCYYFNKGWLDFVGHPLEQETGNGWAESVHPDDFERCLEIYVTNFDARRPFEMEYRLRHHSGQYRWILDRGVPRFTADGTFEGYIGACLDIHDEKEAAEKLRIAAEEVRESEERYRTVAETASDAIVSIDESSTILFANSATADVFGYAPEELIGKNLTLLMPDYMRRMHEAGLQRYVETGHRHLNWEATELPGLHKDGREIPLEVSFGEYTKAGKHYFTGFARDITDRKQAEKALRQSEMEFRGLANSMPTLVWMANPDGWIFWYNQRWHEYTGTTPEQMEGWGWQSVHDPEVLPTVMERWKLSIATGEPFEMTFPIRGADGQFRPFLTRVTPVRDEHGTLTRWFGTNTDVSSEVDVQKKLQTALFASQKLAAIVESSEDAIVSKDLRGIVSAWNPAAERLFGYAAEEIIGCPITAIVPPELQQDEHAILAAIGRGERVDHFETVRLTKSGARIQVSVTVSPIRDEAGNVIGAANVSRDITQQKNAEQALRISERLASVGRLAATVAHEINNPLAAVTNLIYLSKQNAVRDDVREFLTFAEEELDRISHLTKQTLGFYRESKTPTAVTLGSIVESTISIFASRTRDRGITISPEIKHDPEIYAVPGELRQLVGNLLSNSIDAVHPGGKIRIRVSAAARNGLFSRGVRLTVADSGPGIPEDVRARIFEPFFTTKKDVGTGLGLWICKGIVDRYCGSIRIWSRTTEGRSGTVISVVMPVSDQKQSLTDALRQAV